MPLLIKTVSDGEKKIFISKIMNFLLKNNFLEFKFQIRSGMLLRAFTAANGSNWAARL